MYRLLLEFYSSSCSSPFLFSYRRATPKASYVFFFFFFGFFLLCDERKRVSPGWSCWWMQFIRCALWNDLAEANAALSANSLNELSGSRNAQRGNQLGDGASFKSKWIIRSYKNKFEFESYQQRLRVKRRWMAWWYYTMCNPGLRCLTCESSEAKCSKLFWSEKSVVCGGHRVACRAQRSKWSHRVMRFSPEEHSFSLLDLPKNVLRYRAC